jgi:hypothetical protein
VAEDTRTDAFAVRVGDIVQLGPECRNPMFRFCLMVVTEPKAWGAQGYVQAWGAEGSEGGQAYYRAAWSEMAPTGGTAVWVAESLEATRG